ncbi:hypothetical protein BCY91_00895 [Pelobium manganitolerans]|uniref:Uncharacterized protein n=1 Tax=Pelobium manganitolerans TaxID=1842495 RepID=A0A419SBL1_9SPHI|nr:hypothetical protein [Pelobium manganitolerans]RKD20214.1 hypothetical protein BCY91_00895 [Pelobium manganitolerans]
MKKIKFTTALMFVLFSVIATKSNAQISLGVQTFKFQNPLDWSEPLKTSLTSEKFEKKGLAAVPLEFRIKVVKKASSKLAPCKYLVEVKNLSDKQGIYFEARNDYTDPSNKYIYHKVKLGPGETKEFDIAYWTLNWDVKTMEQCTTCSWFFTFVSVKPD